MTDPVDGGESISWQGKSGVTERGIWQFSPLRTVASTQYAASSFDFKNPRPVSSSLPTVNQQGQVPTMEVYEYTGSYGFKDQAAGDAFVRLRMEEIEANGKHFQGMGDDDRMQPGR